jgi:hypothetical protein
MGVDRVDRSSRTKATKNRIDKGVAGRSMMAKNRAGDALRSGSPETGLEEVWWCCACLRTWDAVLRGWVGAWE